MNKTTAYINLGMSVFITIAAMVYMFTMDTYLSDVTEAWPSIVYIPTIVLLAIAMYLLVDPQPVEL